MLPLLVNHIVPKWLVQSWRLKLWNVVINLAKVNNKDHRTNDNCCKSCVFTFNLKYIQLVKIMFLSLTLNISLGSGYLPGIYMFKANNRSTRTRRDKCSKVIIKTPERPKWRRSGVCTANFEHISHLVLVFLLLPLSR